MQGPTTDPRARRGPLLGLPPLAAALLFFAPQALAAPTPVEPPAVLQGGTERPDQVFRKNPRTGKVTSTNGVVSENGLEDVKVGDKTIDAGEVIKIVWGGVPASFRDAQNYRTRGDYERAAALFRSAASDAAARGVVQAAARAEATETLLVWGASDPNRFAECLTEADRFLTDYATDRGVPRVRWIKARATMLSGDAPAAAQLFKALYEEGAAEPPTVGYSRGVCLQAGLDAAQAFLAAGDTLPARELFTALDGAYASLLSAIDPLDDASEHARIAALQAEAAAGEGFCMLTGDQASQAITFFQGIIDRADAGAPGVYAARLGLGQALLADGKHRAAQIEFAKVSAIDHSDRDRSARALLGLARAGLQMAGDSNSADSAKTWLTQVVDQYGDTPSASAASELLKSL